MFDALKRHPFAIEAHFDHCLVLTYALPAALLRPLLPPFLTLDTHGPWGFAAVALVQTRDLRPARWSRGLGRDFFLIGYRLFVKFTPPGRGPLRGLYILRSDTDRLLMKTMGNLLTHYRYRRSQVRWVADERQLEVEARTKKAEADLHVVADLSGGSGDMAQTGVFKSAQEARRFAGPQPYTFDYDPSSRYMTMIRGVRRNWQPRCVDVRVLRQTFFQRVVSARAEPILAAAFYMRDIPYRWERGVRVDCNGGHELNVERRNEE